MKQFLKQDQLQLVNGGYLSNDKGSPVFNANFVRAQTYAEYVVTFAKLAKGKDFKGKNADSLLDLEKEVRNYLDSNKPITFVEKPTLVAKPLTAQLAAEALNFINFQEDTSRVNKINNFLQQFTVLKEFSEFGLFFDEDICKLNKIYTIEEVVSAVTEVIELLN